MFNDSENKQPLCMYGLWDLDFYRLFILCESCDFLLLKYTHLHQLNLWEELLLGIVGLEVEAGEEIPVGVEDFAGVVGR